MIAFLKKLHNSLYIKYGRIYFLISFIFNFQKLKNLPPSIDGIETVLYHYSMTKEHKCYFIQIGAYDGISNDLIYSCVNDFDWHGCLVEPIRENYNQLTQNYLHKNGKLSFFNVAIGNNDGVAEMYTIQKNIDNALPEWCYQLSSFNYKTITSHTKYEPKIESSIGIQLVNIISFGTLLKKLNYPKVDILIIDTEGYDYEILKSIDWAIMQPDIIIFEYVHIMRSELNAIFEIFHLIDYNCYLAKEDCLCVNSKLSELNKKIQKKPFYYKSRLKIN